MSEPKMTKLPTLVSDTNSEGENEKSAVYVSSHGDEGSASEYPMKSNYRNLSPIDETATSDCSVSDLGGVDSGSAILVTSTDEPGPHAPAPATIDQSSNQQLLPPTPISTPDIDQSTPGTLMGPGSSIATLTCDKVSQPVIRTSSSDAPDTGCNADRKCMHDIISLTARKPYTWFYAHKTCIEIMLLIILLVCFASTILHHFSNDRCARVNCIPMIRLVVLSQEIAPDVLLCWLELTFIYAIFQRKRTHQMSGLKCNSCGKIMTTEESFSQELADSKNCAAVKKTAGCFISHHFQDCNSIMQLKAVEEQFCDHFRWKCFQNISHVILFGIVLRHVSGPIDSLMLYILRKPTLVLQMLVVNFILSVYGTEMYVKRYVMHVYQDPSSLPSLRERAKNVVDCISERWYCLEAGMVRLSLGLIPLLVYVLAADVPALTNSSSLSSPSSEASHWPPVIAGVCMGHFLCSPFLTDKTTMTIGLVIDIMIPLTICGFFSPLNVSEAALVPVLRLCFMLSFLLWFEFQVLYWHCIQLKSKRLKDMWHLVDHIVVVALLLVLFAWSVHSEHAALRKAYVVAQSSMADNIALAVRDKVASPPSHVQDRE